jgi:hypothetical protein
VTAPDLRALAEAALEVAREDALHFTDVLMDALATDDDWASPMIPTACAVARNLRSRPCEECIDALHRYLAGVVKVLAGVP